MMFLKSLPLSFLLLAQTFAVSQGDFYRREVIPMPPDEVIEIGSIALLPEKKIAHHAH